MSKRRAFSLFPSLVPTSDRSITVPENAWSVPHGIRSNVGPSNAMSTFLSIVS